MTTKDFAIEKIRKMVNLFNNCNESFNQKYDFRQLERLYDAYKDCDYDFPPSYWSDRQIAEALKGKTPKFNDDEEPDYT